MGIVGDFYPPISHWIGYQDWSFGCPVVLMSARITDIWVFTPNYVPPTKGGRWGGTYCFWDRSRCCRHQRWHRHLRKTSCPFCNLNTFWNILMILGRNVDQDEMTCHIQDWQLWLSYFWSYHPLFYLKKILCLLCNSNTLWNISVVLGRNVEQDQTTCSLQEWQLCLSYFWRYLSLLYLIVIIHWFLVRSVSQRLFGIFLWYLVEL